VVDVQFATDHSGRALPTKLATKPVTLKHLEPKANAGLAPVLAPDIRLRAPCDAGTRATSTWTCGLWSARTGSAGRGAFDWVGAILLRIERRAAVGIRVGALHEGLQRFSPSTIPMDIGTLANSRWCPVHLGYCRRSTVVSPNSEKVFEYLVLSVSPSVTDVLDTRLSECCRDAAKSAIQQLLIDLRVPRDIRAGEGGLAQSRGDGAYLGKDLLITHGAARLHLHSFSCQRAYKPAADFRCVERPSPTTKSPLDTRERVSPLSRIQLACERFVQRRLRYSPQVRDDSGVGVIWQGVGQAGSPGRLAPRSESLPYCCALDPGEGIKLVSCQAVVWRHRGNAPNFRQHRFVRSVFQPSDFEPCHMRDRLALSGNPRASSSIGNRRKADDQT